MGYHVVDPETVPPTPEHPCDRRSIAEEAGLAQLAAAIYTVDPGDQLPVRYHDHRLREEIFYVMDGNLHVETPDRVYTVPVGQVFVAEPDSPHRAYNPPDAAETVRVLGVGAPKVDIARPYDPSE